MTDIAGFNNSIGTGYGVNRQGGITSAQERRDVRETRLGDESDLSSVGALSSEQISQLTGFYNMTLQNIDQLRFPQAFPQLQELQAASPSAATVTSAAGRTGAVADGPRREQIAQQMIAADTPAKASTQEQQNLRTSLSAVSADVLSFAQSRGTKIQVIGEGDDLEQLKVLRPQASDRNAKLLPEMKKMAAEVDGKFSLPIAELEKKKAHIEAQLRKEGKSSAPVFFGMSGQGATDGRIDEINEKLSDLKTKREEFKAQKLKESNIPARPFSTASDEPSGGLFGGGGIGNMLAMVPMSTERMAELHGAKTDREKQDFYRSVEALNGNQLKIARQKGLEEQLAYADGPTKAAILKEYNEHPEKMPFYPVQEQVLVPNTYYYHKPGSSAGSEGTRYDSHDYGTLKGWNTAETGKVEAGRTADGRPDGVMGQYFPYDNVNRILVRDFRTSENTPVHELGHAVDSLVKKEDPAFYKKWSTRVKSAYEGIDREEAAPGAAKRSSISDYSRTNEGEYVAEGFRTYYDDPRRLKSKDPELYNLIQELTAKAAELGHRPR